MIKLLRLPPYVHRFMKVFADNGYEVYVVGGAVRDLLLKRDVHNWDFSTNATPKDILTLFQRAKYENTFGTVLVPMIIKGATVLLEVTPFRKEGAYSDKRHPDAVEWADTIEEDLLRRDFTINAMAYDGKRFIDTVGGLKDIHNKCIRAVGDPAKRIAEDALRMLRAVRLATQLAFLIEEKTRIALSQHAELLDKVSWERKRDEFMKILSSDRPGEGIIFLKNTGLLKYLLPELEKAFSIPQKSPERHHLYDVGTHLVMALQACRSSDPIVRLAVLLHDIGKVNTYQKDEKTGIITFYNHEIVGTAITKEIALRLRLSKKDVQKLTLLVRFHMFSVTEEQTDKAVRRFIRKVGRENINDLLTIREADRVGSGAKVTSWRTELFKRRIEEVQKVPFSITDLKVTGHDVMEILGIKPGKEVGIVLNDIFEKVDSEELKNEKRELVLYIKKTYV